MTRSMSTRALTKALRNYLTHHARISLRCGQRTDTDTGRINFALWLRKDELLRDSHLHADDRATIESVPDLFGLLPILRMTFRVHDGPKRVYNR